MRSVQEILSSNKQMVEKVKQKLYMEQRDIQADESKNLNTILQPKERKRLILSQAHLERLNKVHQRFRRDDEYQMAHSHHGSYGVYSEQYRRNLSGAHHNSYGMQANVNPTDDVLWMNYQRYANPQKHNYNKNPFMKDYKEEERDKSSDLQPLIDQ